MAKIKAVALLCLILGWCLLAPAQPAGASPDDVKWTRVNMPTQGKGGNWVLAYNSDVRHLAMAPDGTLYAYGRGLTYTLYRSSDQGCSWSYIGNVQDEIADIAVAPDDEQTIYYATNSTVYRSTDGGNEFLPLPGGPGGAGSGNIEITALAVTRLDSNIIAVAIRDADSAQFGGIYTLDESQMIPTWVDSNLGNYDAYAVAFSLNYASDRQLVAVATDETDTWVKSKVGEAGWGVTLGNARLDRDNSGTPVAVTASAAIAFAGDYDATFPDSTLFIAVDTGADNGDVYRIDLNEAPGNSPATDLNIGSDFGLNNVDVTGLAASGEGSNIFLLAGAASDAQTYFSDDSGKTWTRGRKEPSGGARTYVLTAPDFTSSGITYAATSGGDSAFSLSRDRGLTYNQVGLIDTYVSTIVDLAISPNYSQDSTLMMATFGGRYSLWRSLDDGGTWERVLTSSLTDVDTIELLQFSPEYGNGSQTFFIVGNSHGSPAIWKSGDNGQSFTIRPTLDPDTGAALPVHAWAAVDDTTLFIGSHDGSSALVYQTSNSGFYYSSGVIAGSQALSSMALSLDYPQDGTILLGNQNGWVYWSSDGGATFNPLPTDATSPPLQGSITVAFDPDFAHNKVVYAASNAADKGVYRFKIGTDREWERVDGNLPSGGTLNQVIVSSDGTLYAANSQADGGLERCLNPTYNLGPTFETVTRGLSDNATLYGVWWRGHRLWSVDSARAWLLTFNDTLTAPVAPDLPSDQAAGIGTLTNNAISNVLLDWAPLKGTQSYQWQLDYDNDFSTVPSGFEGTTEASSVRLPTLDPATTYYWRVRVNDPVLSRWSEKWSFTTALDTGYTSIQLQTPEAGAAGVPIRPVFQWSAVPGADTYELLVSTDVQFSSPLITRTGDQALPGTAWQGAVALDYNTTYFWKVRGLSSNSYSAWSTVGSFTTQLPPAPSPSSSPAPDNAAPMLVPSQPFPPTPSPAPPLSPPALTPPPPGQNNPEWIIYLIGALLLTIILLTVTILVLALRIRRT